MNYLFNTRLPLKREIEFEIELLSGIISISISLYKMALIKLKEQKEQLQDLVDKGFI